MHSDGHAPRRAAGAVERRGAAGLYVTRHALGEQGFKRVSRRKKTFIPATILSNLKLWNMSDGPSETIMIMVACRVAHPSLAPRREHRQASRRVPTP